MGLTYVDVELYNPRNGRKGKGCSFLVDSGAVYSVVPAPVLRALRVKPQREETFTLANGEKVARGVGEVGFRFQGRAATSPVVFGEAKDVYLLGAVTLETLGYVLDPFRRELRPLRMMLA
jgi:clan AA aspartic protease